MVRTSISLLITLLCLATPDYVTAQNGPQPGEIYREFARHNGGNLDWRVTDDQATKRFPRAAAYLPNPRLELEVSDLRHAVRAEVLLDRWGGHRGTINKRIRLNDNDWITVPEIAHVAAGLRPEMLMFQDNPIVAVPLEHLTEGKNIVEGDCDEAGGFGWGQWGIYSVVLRVYYDRQAKGEALGFQAAITSPTAGNRIHEQPEIRLDASSAGGVARIDVLASYDGYDEDGDGRFDGWHGSHFQPVRGTPNDLQNHVGTLWRQPYALRWDTHWVPDQAAGGVSLIARVQDARGYWTVTEPVTGLTLARENTAVHLYRAENVPEDFGVRVDQTMNCRFTIPAQHRLGDAAEAALHLRTWHGADTEHEPLRVNEHSLLVEGKNHHYDYDLLPLPTTALRSGVNRFTIYSKTEHHQLEVLWPGPAVVVRYSKGSGESPAAAGSTDGEKLRKYAGYALTHRGDIERGRALFADKQRTKCAVCHRVGSEGGTVGPDLSKIGGKFDRPHLVESLLEPSRQIVEGYRTTNLVTAEGRVMTGIAVSPNDTSVTLVDAEGREHLFKREAIESISTSSTSLMPEGISENVSQAEFTDLIAYLETLRTGPAKFGADVSGPVSLPAGFQIETVATGLTGATAFETLDDGRILLCEQTGNLRVIKNGKLLAEPFLTLDVDNNWERGLIGVTVAPEFPQEPYVYVCYVAQTPYPHHRISRFRAEGDRAVAGSEQILLRGDDQRQLGGHVPAGHQGGGMHFGQDGKLYVGIGEQTAEMPAQHLTTFQGKLLRINRDGTIPSDNPFLDQASGKYRAIWAIGCRNPFTFSVHPVTGEMLINDVGGKYEEINRGVAGANYGWPVLDHGPTSDPAYVGPIHIYPQASISGGDFAPPAGSWGELAGRYFFADFVHGWIKTLDPAHPEAAEVFAAGLRRPVDLRFSVDGSLYVLLRNAWVIDGKFEGGTGSLMRIRRAASAG